MTVSRVLKATVALTVLGLLAGPCGILAQKVSLRGMVVSAASGEPLGGILVALDSGERARTDKKGVFRLDGVPPGHHQVALVGAGCQITWATVETRAVADFTVAFQMEYSPEVATAARSRSAEGRVVGGAELRALHARDLTDVLARLFPGLVGTTTQPGQEPRLRSRAVTSLSGPVEPAVIVDGQLMGSTGLARINDIPLSDVAWIHVRRGASGGWEVGTGGSGGVIRIETRRGGQPMAPFRDPAQCELPAGFGSGDAG